MLKGKEVSLSCYERVHHRMKASVNVLDTRRSKYWIEAPIIALITPRGLQ